MKALGLKAGAPDNLIFTKIGKWRGVAIELKAKGGKVRENQREWMLRLTDEGWICNVCWSAVEAIEWVEELIAGG